MTHMMATHILKRLNIFFKAGPAYVPVLLFLFIIFNACSDGKGKVKPAAFTDEGILVYRLGSDTIGYQFFKIRNDSLRLRTIYFPGGFHYNVTDALFDEEGKIAGVESVEMENDSLGNLVTSKQLGVNAMGLITTVINRRAGGKKPFTYAHKVFAVNDAGPAPDYFFPIMPRYIPGRDSVVGEQLAFGKPRRFWLYRVTENLVYAGGDLLGKVKMRVDSANHLLSLDATESPLRVKGEVYRNMNFDSLLAAVRSRPELTSVPALSPVSKKIYHFPELDVMLNYSMPSKRGRPVFGKLVSYQDIWRMGANRATEITFSEPVYFGQRKLVPGTYTLFAIIAPHAGILVVNDKSNIWGTDHDYQWDGLRVPFIFETMDKPREQLNLQILRTGAGRYRLQMEWDTLRGSVDFGISPAKEPVDEEDTDDDPDDDP